MNVAYGVTMLARGLSGGGVDGIGHYTQELYKALSHSVELIPYSFGFSMKPNVLNRETLLFNKYPLELVKGALCPPLRMTSIMGKSKVDLIHATDHIIPFTKGVPLVATLMDAISISSPELVNDSIVGRAKINLWRRMTKHADHILTISEYSKTEIIRYFGIDSSRISVVPLGVDHRYFNSISDIERKATLKKYNISKPYFINIGTLQPRKNIARLLEAMRCLPGSVRKSYSLVIAGGYGWKSDDLVDEIKKAEREGWCKWLGYIPDNDLLSLLQSSELLVYPSLYEGFGLPVLEAFASKTPVVASNTTSIPEVAADSAILVDPINPSDIASAIAKIVENKDYADMLIKKGFERARNMTWERCAEGTLNVYKQVIGLT